MPNIKSIVSTVVSEFSLLLHDGKHQSYDYQADIVCKGEEEPVNVKLRLEGDGLSVWVSGAPTKQENQEIENEVYFTVRPLPIVRQTIWDINKRADDENSV
jgi:hypothetical protein